MYGYGNSMFLATHGILARTASGGGIDPDAQAFITAASITDPTQQTAINQLVVDLKGYNIWTKMKAIYPIVGGTASTHKWNLKDPRDLDAAFRLVFSGGVTHSSTGVTFNGTNGYADTKVNDFGQLNNNNKHISMYQRNILASISNSSMGADNLSNRFFLNFSGNNYSTLGMNQSAFAVQTPQQGMFAMSKTASGSFKYFQNALTPVTKTGSDVSSLYNYFIGACNLGGNPFEYAAANIAFASIGDGLTDTEAANFYTAVQAFQVTLGRSIGTQTVSDADAQAFVTNAGIVDQVEANAVNNLVIGLKADGLWTKMKAVYPFVGGTSTTNKYNLKNPLDTDAAFRLVFNGGWTFSSTGATPNGTNAYADTKLLASTQLGLNSTHVSVYSRSNTDVLAPSISNDAGGQSYETSLWLRTGNLSYLRVNTPTASTQSNTDSRGTFIGNRISSTQQQLMIRGVRYDYSVNSNALSTIRTYTIGSTGFFDNKQLAFASIGDGLTNTEMTNLTTAIVTFQTTLNRQVP